MTAFAAEVWKPWVDPAELMGTVVTDNKPEEDALDAAMQFGDVRLSLAH